MVIDYANSQRPAGYWRRLLVATAAAGVIATVASGWVGFLYGRYRAYEAPITPAELRVRLHEAGRVP